MEFPVSRDLQVLLDYLVNSDPEERRVTAVNLVFQEGPGKRVPGVTQDW